jgi:hypothetical protein
MAKYRMTAAMESLVRGLRRLSEEIEPKLHLVSQAARSEWNALQNSWPSDDELREGATVFTEHELKASESKVRRFSDILHGFEHGFEPKVSERPALRPLDDGGDSNPRPPR